MSCFRSSARAAVLSACAILLAHGQGAALGVEPEKGGTLVIGRGGDSVGLDPATQLDGESLDVTDQIFDTLVTVKPGTTEVAPSLAETWDVSKDGLTYTFSLVKNAKFHDGTPVNADAVVFSFKRQLDKTHEAYKFGGPYSRLEATGLDQLLKDVVTVDDLTVEFVLNQPYTPFLATLGMRALAIVSPAAVLAHKRDFTQHPVGSGPYKLKAWDEKKDIVLEVNKDYWGPKPRLETLVFRAIPDGNARLKEMTASKLHVLESFDASAIDALQSKLGAKFKLLAAPRLDIGYLAMNNEKPPFDKLEVRQAIAHAIDKKAIVGACYDGYAQVAKNPMPPAVWGYNDGVEDYEHDPTKAKELLKKAGLEAGFETDLWAIPVPRPYMPDGRKVAEMIQRDLAKVGIKAKIVSHDWNTYLQKLRNGEHAMALLGWTGDSGDPDDFLYVLLDKDNAAKPAQNISFYKSKKLHKRLIKAQFESDTKKRLKLYLQAQEIIHADVPMIPIAHSTEVIPIQTTVENFVIDPTGHRRYAEVWLNE